MKIAALLFTISCQSGKKVFISTIIGFLVSLGVSAQTDLLETARIRPEIRTGFSNGGWNLDRYKDLKPLVAHTSIVVADLKGPGVIKHIHTTRHMPEELFTRGVVLEIWFDDATEPAVSSPLGDFFGDGCNGKSMYFTSLFIECAPYSYNCYIPMPFRSRARVILRNDTGENATNYSYVEWEPLPSWDKQLGYFHATFARQCFQLTRDTRITLFETPGKGHLLGRQFSIITDEPFFRDFGIVMEGNNEVDIDGAVRKIDYLGTEDSFTFSWGFLETFTGLRAGMTFLDKYSTPDSTMNRLSIYRFHDHMPIRFTESIKWSIDWIHEITFINRPEWPQRVAAGGCQVDYSTVFYWYAGEPGGFTHQPLSPVAERQKPMLHPSAVEVKK